MYVITHLRPLKDSEVLLLANKRRRKQIKKYFLFNDTEFKPKKSFKKRMNPKGSFYNVDISLYNFPSYSASLLKYKKHEWIIVGFEKNKKINYIWLNKGFNRDRVYLFLCVEDIVKIGLKNNYSSVLIMHNHPNINPAKFDCTQPSKGDIASAKEFASELNLCGLNLLEFICERGKHYEFYRSFSSSFIPVEKIVNEINMLNGKSRKQNLLLHLQKLF